MPDRKEGRGTEDWSVHNAQYPRASLAHERYAAVILLQMEESRVPTLAKDSSSQRDARVITALGTLIIVNWVRGGGTDFVRCG